MIVIALALILIAAACAAVLMDATRSMLPGVSTSAPLVAAAEVPAQRTRETSPDAIDDAAHRAYGFVNSLPTEPRTTYRGSL